MISLYLENIEIIPYFLLFAHSCYAYAMLNIFLWLISDLAIKIIKIDLRYPRIEPTMILCIIIYYSIYQYTKKTYTTTILYNVTIYIKYIKENKYRQFKFPSPTTLDGSAISDTGFTTTE